MTRIIITNVVALNGGGGAILFGMIKILRHAFGVDCDVRVYGSNPEVATRMFPEIVFRESLGLSAARAPLGHVRYLGRLLRELQQARYGIVAWLWTKGAHFASRLLPSQQRQNLAEYAAADFIASSGGTYLKEEYGVISQACDFQLTRLLERPLVFFTQSLGPFTKAKTRRILTTAFKNSPCILVRDLRSKRHLTDLGVDDSRIQLAADAAFALADPEIIERARCKIGEICTHPKVAISVRKWSHFDSRSNETGMNQYRLSVAASVRSLVQLGAKVTFISTCQGIAEYDDDSLEADLIVKLLDPATAARVEVVHGFIRFDELLRRLQEFDLCIGTRMHMCILSLISGTPALPIAYEFKTQELFTSLGMAKWVTDIESISPSAFTDMTLRFLQAIPEIRGSVFAQVLALHNDAMESGRIIREALSGKPT